MHYLHSPHPWVLEACSLEMLEFGRKYIIPKPLDPRLIDTIAEAVREAAIASNAVHGN